VIRSKTAPAWWIAAAAGVASSAVVAPLPGPWDRPALAQVPRPTGRAALVVAGADGTETSFVGAFLSTAMVPAAERLGLRLRPWRAVSAVADELRGDGPDASPCPARERCVRSLAQTVAAPLLVFVDVGQRQGRRLQANVVGVRVTEAAIRRVGPDATVRGDEGDLASAVAARLEALVADPIPCTLELRGADGGAVPDGLRLRVDDAGERPAGALLFLEPGPHRLSARAPGRGGSDVRLECEPGRRYALEVGE